jgi:Flp pilus assembly protein TadD
MTSRKEHAHHLSLYISTTCFVFNYQVIESYPTNPIVRHALADSLLRQEKLDDAERELNVAIQCDAAYEESHNTLGLVLMQKGFKRERKRKKERKRKREKEKEEK